MYLAFVVVEIEGDAAVFLALPIFVYYVVFLEDSDEVICVFLARASTDVLAMMIR